MHKTNYLGMNVLLSGEKVSCPPSTVLHVEICKKTRRTYDLKLNALNLVPRASFPLTSGWKTRALGASVLK